MGKTLPQIDDDLKAWIEKQKMFFVATAPLSPEGHVNLSPKGGDSLRVLGPLTVAYHDFTDSGVETISHLRENGRIVIMLCAFDGAPRIVRLHGRGEFLLPDHPDFGKLLPLFPPNIGSRSIIRIQVERIASSCGFQVPLYEFKADRTVLDEYARKRGAEGLYEYRCENNVTSIDGLPGLSGLSDKPRA